MGTELGTSDSKSNTFLSGLTWHLLVGLGLYASYASSYALLIVTKLDQKTSGA